MNTNISILAEIPEELHQSLKNYLDTHPTWDQDRVFSAALALFFQQNAHKPEIQLFPTASSLKTVYLPTQPFYFPLSEVSTALGN
ncbi:DUF2811 domain-containing protein [Lusitaniella coriacea LEGE 07157]|uniref:DUF2811 domain-containing protein n=1 Tax=Lusitaniella coriacea LEGE 07157 TaxID=945747 RepID=A0A8J7E1U8_9CYAN|nr:DUF2811 domain-containing protein [Lusitaniella coriacea]MBE9118031.1 DUF2811 domain-containing protein [Lusitaniella coriacea LEGE 07157]